MSFELPDGWSASPLHELVRVHHGFAFKGEYFSEEPSGNVLVTPGNFAIGGGFQWGKRKYYDGPVDERFVLAAGDLVVTMTDLSKASDTLGSPALIPMAPAGVRLLHNQRIGRVEIIAPDRVTGPYLYTALRAESYRQQIVASATGTTVKHTSPSRIGDAVVALPPLDEQRRIAEILAALDKKVDNNHRFSTTLRETSRLIYDHMTAAAPLEVPLGDVAEVVDCLHSKKPAPRSEGKLLLQLANIRDDGLLDLESQYFIDDNHYAAWTRRIETRRGDCVVTNVGRVGAVARIPDLQAALGRNMTGVRCKADWPYRGVLIEALLSRPVRRQIEKLTDAGTVMNAFNVRSIPKLRLPVLEPHVLASVDDAVEPLWRKREALLSENRLLRQARAALLPGLVSGRLRPMSEADEQVVVRPAESAIAEALV